MIRAQGRKRKNEAHNASPPSSLLGGVVKFFHELSCRVIWSFGFSRTDRGGRKAMKNSVWGFANQ